MRRFRETRLAQNLLHAQAAQQLVGRAVSNPRTSLARPDISESDAAADGRLARKGEEASVGPMVRFDLSCRWQLGRRLKMQALRIRVVVPDDHRAVVEFPETVRSGPVELIVLVPQENESSCKPEGQGRMAALAGDLARDPRPFRELSPEQRSARLEKVMGVGRGLMSTSEELAKRKREEIDLE